MACDPRAAWEKRGPYSDSEVNQLLELADPQERLAILLTRLVWPVQLRAAGRAALNEEHPHLVVRGKDRTGYREAVALSRRAEEAIQAWLPSLPAASEHLLTWRTRKTVVSHVSALCACAGIRLRAVTCGIRRERGHT